jgi:hypothetical protein
MEVIQQKRLSYRAGSSEKIHEIEICRIDDNHYLVNYRYGKLGRALKEDTATPQPVSLAQAQAIYDKDLRDKLAKGYQETEISSLKSEPSPSQEVLKTTTREETILQYLRGERKGKWKLDRVIWRAGELKIAEAAPLLLALLGSDTPLRDYSIIWALGGCGDSSVIPQLQQIYNNSAQPEHIRRIAWEAWYKLAGAQEKQSLITQKLQELPDNLRALAISGSQEDFQTALQSYLEEGDWSRFAVLDTLYQIDNQNTRPALLAILRSQPLKPNYFQRIRHIFKMAEYRRDGEVFALITYRLDKEKPFYNSSGWSVRLPDGTWLAKYNYSYNRQTRRYDKSDGPLQTELKRPDSRLGYSSNTRDYLRSRVWRTLREMGEREDPDYIKMAMALLLQYNDRDAQEVKQSAYYRYEPGTWRSVAFPIHWDEYAGYLNFNHILYENSPRYFLKYNGKAWQCAEGYKPGGAPPETREEAFPQLWEKHPGALLELLLQSNCAPVHHFAAKALRICRDFCESISLNNLIKLLDKPYTTTAQLAFELVQKRYNPQQPNLEILRALANCFYTPAREKAHQWIGENRDQILEDSSFVASLIISPYRDTRELIRTLILSSFLREETTKKLLARIIAQLFTFTSEQAEIALEINQFFVQFSSYYNAPLRTIEMGVILDLLGHPLPEIQTIGATILLNHATPAADLPPQLIQSLLDSPHQMVRVVGVQIFGQLPDNRLLANPQLLLAMITNPDLEIREAVRPSIVRLVNNYGDFARYLIGELINILLKKEATEGFHSYLVSLIRKDLANTLQEVDQNTTLRLTRAKSGAAQELAGVIIQLHCQQWAETLTTSEIVKLASSEILTIRQAAWQMFEQKLPVFRSNGQEMLAAVRLLEAKWDDSKEFAWRVFQTEFGAENWTAEVLISLCDSNDNKVRKFAQDLVLRYFQGKDGEEYLLKFSESPKEDIQLFATNYLEEYARDNLDNLKSLQGYFVTVLSRVNSARKAKDKIFVFLEKEAAKNREAAEMIGEIMARQSLTIAKGDRSKTIQTMLKIKHRYPEIELPLKLV